MDIRIHSFSDLNVLPEGFIVLQGGGNLMRAERHVSESVRGHLRRLSIQENCGTDGFGLDRERGNLYHRSEQQMDFWVCPLPNLNVLPKGFIVLQSGGNLMRAERHVTKGIWGYLRRFSVQEDCRTDGLGLDRKRGYFLNRSELQ